MSLRILRAPEKHNERQQRTKAWSGPRGHTKRGVIDSLQPERGRQQHNGEEGTTNETCLLREESVWLWKPKNKDNGSEVEPPYFSGDLNHYWRFVIQFEICTESPFRLARRITEKDMSPSYMCIEVQSCEIVLSNCTAFQFVHASCSICRRSGWLLTANDEASFDGMTENEVESLSAAKLTRYSSSSWEAKKTTICRKGFAYSDTFGLTGIGKKRKVVTHCVTECNRGIHGHLNDIGLSVVPLNKWLMRVLYEIVGPHDQLSEDFSKLAENGRQAGTVLNRRTTKYVLYPAKQVLNNQNIAPLSLNGDEFEPLTPNILFLMQCCPSIPGRYELNWSSGPFVVDEYLSSRVAYFVNFCFALLEPYRNAAPILSCLLGGPITTRHSKIPFGCNNYVSVNLSQMSNKRTCASSTSWFLVLKTNLKVIKRAFNSNLPMSQGKLATIGHMHHPPKPPWMEGKQCIIVALISTYEVRYSPNRRLFKGELGTHGGPLSYKGPLRKEMQFEAVRFGKVLTHKNIANYHQMCRPTASIEQLILIGLAGTRHEKSGPCRGVTVCGSQRPTELSARHSQSLIPACDENVVDLEYADGSVLVFEEQEKAQMFLDELTKAIPSFHVHFSPTKFPEQPSVRPYADNKKRLPLRVPLIMIAPVNLTAQEHCLLESSSVRSTSPEAKHHCCTVDIMKHYIRIIRHLNSAVREIWVLLERFEVYDRTLVLSACLEDTTYVD
ncbi:hypothetical protein CLF_104207 [Clonorchis sinensis]|uniref:Uncharacterized protein n=1 Tax=Clonorchis sinensis TaxID=79923 RepID=G7YNT4_CLOSI|nr:hypothetical protein CLF_104207 [Clonorchis sinensis]